MTEKQNETHVPRSPGSANRPDPRQMRIVYGFMGLATFTALTTAIVGAPSQTAASSVQAGTSGVQVTTSPSSPQTVAGSTAILPSATSAPSTPARRVIKLAPGQTPPPGAAVITAPVPSPQVVIQNVTIPGPVIVTSQSGVPIR